MSIKSSLALLLLLLLCFSLHACNARNLGVAHSNDPAEKNDHNLNPGSLSIQHDNRKYSSGEEAKMEKKLEENKFINGGEYNEPGKYFEAKRDSRATKKWRVPHRKRGRQEPGFNQDYSPPKTHPPVHN